MRTHEPNGLMPMAARRLCAVFLLGSAGLAGAQSDPWRFANVKEWRYSIVIDAHDEVRKNEQGTEEHYLANIGGKVEARLVRGQVDSTGAYFSDQGQTEWPSNILYRVKAYKKHTEPDGRVTWSERLMDGGGRVITGALPLTIYPERGTYKVQRFNWMLQKGAIAYRDSNGVSVNQAMPMALPFTMLKVLGEEAPLPTAGMILEGSDSFDWPQDPFAANGPAGRPLTVTYTWTLMPWNDEAGDPRLEGPSDWLPKAGVPTFVKATWKGTASEIKFTLYDVSKEPGTCMNSADGGTEPDLSILKGAGYQIEEISGGWTARAKVAGDNQALLPLECRDYAARGKVKCEVRINGKWEPAKAGDKAFLALPEDEDDNKVADRWEEEKGIQGLGSGDDSEASEGHANKGDGFTLYEEYRGLLVKGQFQRLDPQRKELFVVNMVGGDVDAGIGLFSKAADVDVLQGYRTEFDPSRVVNFRKNTVAKGGDQHGLMIAMGDAQGGAGLTRPVKVGATYTASPGAVQQINVAVGFNEFGPAAAAKDVAHELGHACGLRHHGEGGVVRLESQLYDSAGNVVIQARDAGWQVYDANGSEITTRPFRIPSGAKIAFAKGTPAGGDVDCIMCYESVFSFAFHASGGLKALANKPDQAPGTLFCTSPAGTRYNAADHAPFALFGDASEGRGNCRSKLKVKDW